MFLIGCSKFPLRHDQSVGLPRSGVVTRHQFGICALVCVTSLRGESQWWHRCFLRLADILLKVVVESREWFYFLQQNLYMLRDLLAQGKLVL